MLKLVSFCLIFISVSLGGFGCYESDPFEMAIYRVQEKKVLKSLEEIRHSHYSWTQKNRLKKRELEQELKVIRAKLKSNS